MDEYGLYGRVARERFGTWPPRLADIPGRPSPTSREQERLEAEARLRDAQDATSGGRATRRKRPGTEPVITA